MAILYLGVVLFLISNEGGEAQLIFFALENSTYLNLALA